MLRTAFLFQAIVAPLVIGVLVLATLMIPALESSLRVWIVASGVVGFVLAIPISLIAAKSAPGISL